MGTVMVIWATAVGVIITGGEEATGTITGITRTSTFVTIARTKIDVPVQDWSRRTARPALSESGLLD
jgi:hypothetical protein